MAGLGLGSYGSDASSDDEGDAQAPYPLTQPLALEDPEESEEESEEEEAEVAEAEEEMIGPVVPLALSGAVEESDEEEAPAPLEDESEEDAPSGLPPPDFGDWDPEAGTAAEQSLAAQAERAPQVTGLGKKRDRAPSGPHQISRGFSAAVTRRDQLKAKAEEDLANDAAVRGVNSGMSNAYDSVFHVPESSLTEDEIEKKKRMRTTRKGGVKMISKKELAKEQALEASLMD